MENTEFEQLNQLKDPEIASIEESLLNSAKGAGATATADNVAISTAAPGNSGVPGDADPATSKPSQQSPMKKEKRPKNIRAIISVTVAVAIVLGLGAFLGYLILGKAPSPESGLFRPAAVPTPNTQVAAPTEEELRIREAVEAGVAADDPNLWYLPTPLIATYDDLLIHSPIVPRDITEIEFHQASYDTALQMTPLLIIVDAEEVSEKHGTNHIPYEAQPHGDKPLIAEAVSTWRLNSVGDEMTAVDVGAPAGTDVYAPISGTVVKIKSYRLYDMIDDYEIHIQSPDHPELDIVVLHIDQVTIKVGDKVIGGSTRIAKVRDLGEDIDSNLLNFTMPPDPGFHCHVQINDATRESYKGLEGALDIFNGRGYVRS